VTMCLVVGPLEQHVVHHRVCCHCTTHAAAAGVAHTWAWHCHAKWHVLLTALLLPTLLLLPPS
jgi:hypothetical protein